MPAAAACWASSSELDNATGTDLMAPHAWRVQGDRVFLTVARATAEKHNMDRTFECFVEACKRPLHSQRQQDGYAALTNLSPL
jgi:hypothetical protein